MDEGNDVDTLDVTKFKAAVPFADVIKEGETKKKILNIITDIMLDYFSSVIKFTIVKKGLNATCLVIIILTDKTQHQELIDKVCILTKKEIPFLPQLQSSSSLRTRKISFSQHQKY